MSSDPAAMLRLLFAIPQTQIDHDAAEGERDFDRLIQETYASHLEHRDNKEPKVAAEYHHKQMVRAKVLYHRENLPEEYKLFYAAMAANKIAEEAVSVAHEQGRLAELGRRMDEIQKREELQDDEFWPIGEGPADYQELSNESEELYDKVRDTVFTTVLCRYRLNDIADLYENDRNRYDELSERGRKMIFEDRAKSD
jgi:hypothetical protein